MICNLLCRVVLSTLAVIAVQVTCFAQTQEVNQDRASESKLVVHEWGTFTELQNDQGISLSGINTNDEPVPNFVYGMGSLLDPTLGPRFAFPYGKSLPFRFEHLTMRLETPVIYFYPPSDEPMVVDVKVGLLDGWLSEYYPFAEFKAHGIEKRRVEKGKFGTLQWKGLTVGGPGVYRETEDPVWLKPRATRAATVTTEKGESEKYLFYRGVGEFSGPVKIEVDREQGTISPEIKNLDEHGRNPVPAWLLEIRDDGRIAYRKIDLPSYQSAASEPSSYRFSSADYNASRIENLKEQMLQSLIENGLYADEAAAMLATWNHAYFQSPGLRLFYVVPKTWVEKQMPLKVTGDPAIERVMVGRIELISDAQKKLVEVIDSSSIGNLKWMAKIWEHPQWTPIVQGKDIPRNLMKLRERVSIPKSIDSYIQLGRFRNAILKAESKKNPSGNLPKFVKAYLTLGNRGFLQDFKVQPKVEIETEADPSNRGVQSQSDNTESDVLAKLIKSRPELELEID